MARLKKANLNKISSDLGEANIPEQFVKQAIIPNDPMSLYWREIAEGNKTIEIWSTEESKFVIVEGDFTTGQWTADSVSLVSEHDKLADAIEEVRTAYVFKDGGAAEPQQQQDEVQQPEQQKESGFKRMLKKVRGS